MVLHASNVFIKTYFAVQHIYTPAHPVSVIHIIQLLF